jgi:hypothetical protein
MKDLKERIARLSSERRALFEKQLEKAGLSVGPEPIPRRGLTGPGCLSFAQHRLWFLDRLVPGNPFYNEPLLAIRIEGALSIDNLQRTFNEITFRHETLRSSFPGIDGSPVVVVAAPGNLPIFFQDLSTESEATRAHRLQEITRQEARRSFDLANGPLFCVTLLRLSASEHLLLVAMHHIISDGWSLRILLRELMLLYQTFSRGGPSPLPELPIQYGDYAVWQRERLQGAALERLLDYWRKRLGGGLTPLLLPTDRAPSKEPSYYGSSESLILPRPLVAAIRAVARRDECTLFMFMLTAFKILLQRYTGQSDIAVGVPVAGRTHPATEALIGFFVNTLVMRTDLSGNPTFQEASARVRTTAIEAYANHELPLDMLVQQLHPERDGVGRQPLFQVMYSHHNYAREHYQLDNLLMERVEVAAEDAKFDLVLLTDESSTEELHVELNYSIDLFDSATIKIMLQRFVTLLKNIVAAPRARLSALGVLSSDEEAVLESRKSKEAAELQNRLRRLKRSAMKIQ